MNNDSGITSVTTHQMVKEYKKQWSDWQVMKHVSNVFCSNVFWWIPIHLDQWLVSINKALGLAVFHSLHRPSETHLSSCVRHIRIWSSDICSFPYHAPNNHFLRFPLSLTSQYHSSHSKWLLYYQCFVWHFDRIGSVSWFIVQRLVGGRVE